MPAVHIPGQSPSLTDSDTSDSQDNSFRGRSTKVVQPPEPMMNVSQTAGPNSKAKLPEMNRTYLGADGSIPLNADASPMRGSRRTLSVGVRDVLGVRTPSQAPPMTEPQIHVGLGKVSMLTGVGHKGEGGDTYRFEQSKKLLPHNGESYLRFLLTDGTYQVGFADVPIADDVIGEHWEGPVALHGRDGVPCGTLRVVIDKTGDRIQPGISETALPMGTPANTTAPGTVPSSSTKPVSAVDSSDDEASVQGDTRVNQRTTVSQISCPSFCVRLAECTGVSTKQTPYFLGTYNKKTLRTQSLKEKNADGSVMFRDEFHYPYVAGRNVDLQLCDDIALARDEVIGYGSINLDQVLAEETKKEISVPLVNKEGANIGAVNVIIEPKSVTLKKAKCVEAAEIVPGGLYKSVLIKAQFADDLVDPKPNSSDVIDPYIAIKHGTDSFHGKQHKDAGLSPIFMETYRFKIHPGQPIELSIFDKESLSKDVLVGTGKLDLPELNVRSHNRTYGVDLFKDNKPAGRLYCEMNLLEEDTKKPEIVPSKEDYTGKDPLDFSIFEETAIYSSFVITIVSGKEILNKKGKVDSGLDPYVELINGGNSIKTDIHKNQGPNPTFNESFIFPVTTHRFLRLNVYDDAFGKDPLLSIGKVDLTDVVCEEAGLLKLRVPVRTMKGKPAGELFVEMVPSDKKVTEVAKHETASEALAGYQATQRANVPHSTIQFQSRPPSQTNRSLSTFEQPSQIQSLYQSVEIEVVKIQSLKNPNPSDILDPYVTTSWGKLTLNGPKHENAGDDPNMGDLFSLPYQPYQYLKLEVKDHANLHKDQILGTARINIDTFASNENPQQKLKVPLSHPITNSPAGTMYLKLRFYDDARFATPRVERLE